MIANAPLLTGRRVARHTAWHFAGLVVPLAVAVAVIPIAATALGPVRFGLLGTAWALLEYLSLSDLGLARSTVKFAAEALARRPADARQIVAVSLASQIALALVAGAVLAAAGPLLANDIFSVPPEFTVEAAAMFTMVGLNVPVVIAMTGMRAVLEAGERFALAAAIRIPGTVASIAIPAVGAVYGLSLPEIFVAVFVARLLVCVALAVGIARVIPGFRWELPRDWRRLRELLSYSGWVAISGFASPLLVHFDRFALGAIAGMAAVGFYTAPYEAMSRFLLVPISLFAALFPAVSAARARNEGDQIARLLVSASRQLAAVMAPVCLLAAVLAPEILTAWMGSEYGLRAATALRMLALGVFANALAHVPSVFLYSAGRPDVPAKLHMVELALYVPFAIWLVREWGITGAATAWSVRVSADAVGLWIAAARLRAFRSASEARMLTRLAVAVAGLLFGVMLIAVALEPPLSLAAAVLLLPWYAAYVWFRVLTAPERAAWRSLVERRSSEPPGAVLAPDA